LLFGKEAEEHYMGSIANQRSVVGSFLAQNSGSTLLNTMVSKRREDQKKTEIRVSERDRENF